MVFGFGTKSVHFRYRLFEVFSLLQESLMDIRQEAIDAITRSDDPGIARLLNFDKLGAGI